MDAQEMPKYKCHKTVRALKIHSIEYDADGSTVIRPAEDGYAPFVVPCEYVLRHKPSAGGYYVRYDDGYTSYSPAQAFEDGYMKVEQ